MNKKLVFSLVWTIIQCLQNIVFSPTIRLIHNNPQKRYNDSFDYGLGLAGCVKNLLLTGFALFSQKVGYVKSRMVYPFGYKAIQFMIN